MSLDIQIGGQSLDINDVELDITEENPFLQLSEKQQGEFSMPFDVPLTDNNNRLLNYAGQIHQRKTQDPIGAIIHENGVQHSQGTLHTENVGSNLNRATDGSVSLYYAFGVGSFFSLIKEKRLPEVDFGPIEQYPWQGDTFTGPGFWAHVHRVMHGPDPAVYNYAIFPAKNTQDVNTYFRDIYNAVFSAPSSPYDTGFFALTFQKIVPFPYLKNVLLKTFQWLGWQVEGTPLSDPDFEKIVLLNAYPVSWVPEKNNGDPITIDLALHVPDITISNFLLGLRVRFGWWYDFDFHKKKCTIRHLSAVYQDRVRKDQTTNVSAPYKIQVEKQQKIYSLQATQEGTPPVLSAFKYQGTRATKYGLPTATDLLVNQVYFVAGENNYYVCLSQDEQDTVFGWELLSSNAVAYQPPGFTDTIPTTCNIPVMTEDRYHTSPFFTGTGYILFPEFSMPVNNTESEDFFVCYAQGDVLRYTDSGVSDKLYPYGSPHNYDPNGNLVGTAVLAWQYTNHATQSEIGLAALYWQQFLEKFTQVETATFIFYLPFDQLQRLGWIDSHIIRNTEWIVKTRKRVLPYSGFLECTCIRI